MNVTKLIGAVLSQRLASYRDLDEALSVSDCLDLLEIAMIDAHNRRLMQPKE